MAFILKDRVQETATANTTVSFTLSGAATGYQSFSAIGDTNSTYYGATDGTNWEVGVGTYTLSTTTLSRDTILSSSNSGSAVTFSGTVTVWCDYPASKSVSTDYTNALGVVTPNTGTFTTLTAQTEVLKGTGENFMFYSQVFQNANWSKQTNVTATDNATTAPDGTNTAASISWGSASNGTGIYQFRGSLSWTGITNTKSIYVRADVAGGTVTLQDPGNTVGISTLTLSTSWQRISLSESAQTATAGVWLQRTASSPSTVYVWGGQLEIGTSAGIYTPTTSAVVYGTPSLSFSGVAGLGLQSDGSLYVSPAGTGAIQAQATTSSATGGNARGANAVDWQTSRNAAGQVASGIQSFLGGGYANSSTAQYAATLGGGGNATSGFASFVGAGYLNTASGQYSTIGGGYQNSAAGYYTTLIGGALNSGTANAAVTTQTTTTVTNGSTAVTLSGSNASIKVGQLITGTGIQTFPHTYVAAISGTSLTLSQNATASGSPTLSFYTPHGVVVGGGNNQATGSYSFIGGGGDAGTAANRNTASGDWSGVASGNKNTASGNFSFVGGGNTNTASQLFSAVVGGTASTASGSVSFVGGSNSSSATNYNTAVIGGQNNTASGTNSAVLSGSYGTSRGLLSYNILSSANPIANTSGATQAALVVLGKQTTDATPTVLVSDTNAAGTTNQVILPNNSAYYFKAKVISGVTGAGNTKAWTLEGAIKRGANAASTAIVGTVTTTIVAADVGAATWTVTATADTTNGGLAITFTGQAGTTIRTVCSVESVEMTF